MYPETAAEGGFYPPDEVIPAQTSRNRAAILYLLDKADCPYKVIGKEGQYCSGAPATNTGMKSPTASSAETSSSGDNNGYEINASNALKSTACLPSITTAAQVRTHPALTRRRTNTASTTLALIFRARH